MAAFPSGVAIITTLDEDRLPRGLTTTAVCSVSADPPLILVCVDRGSRTLPSLRSRRQFVVNFARVGAEALCDRFASKEEDKFAGVAWRPSPLGLPILDGHALAWLECEAEQHVEAGDHVVLIGRARAGGAPLQTQEPVVYHDRRYGRWTALHRSARR